MRKIFGHRGLPRIYKENTFTGINKAYEHCDFVEIDVRLTGDNQLILHHDPNIGDDFTVNDSAADHVDKQHPVKLNDQECVGPPRAPFSKSIKGPPTLRVLDKTKPYKLRLGKRG